VSTRGNDAVVFSGGTVVTGDRSRPTDALAVRDGRVVALGAAAGAVAGRRVDLRGGALLPGFRDGHIHPLWGGIDLALVPAAEATSLDDLLAAVSSWAVDHPYASWVTGGGYSPALAAGGIFDATWLDRAVPDRPVVLQAADYHTAWANSTAMRLAGIDAGTPDPPRGQIVRRPDGSPRGTLRESAQELVLGLVPAPDSATKREGLRRAVAAMSAAGIVWAQEASLEPRDVPAYLDLGSRGELPCRVNIALRISPDRWREQVPEFTAARALARDHGGSRVTVGTVKFFVDGVIEAGTGALLEPYTDEPGSYGLANWQPAELADAVQAMDAAGLQAHLHAIGDAAVRMALDAVERCACTNGPRDRRPVIAHAQLIHPDDLPRFAELGVIANIEPLWACPDAVMTELTEPRLGPVRSAWQYPMQGLLDSGARLSFGSDWPVSSLNPLAGLAVAVSRQTPDGRPAGGWLPRQRLDFDAALAAYTTGTAYQAYDDDAGRLIPGAPADLCLVPADPHLLSPAELSDLPVTATWLGGVEVHHAG